MAKRDVEHYSEVFDSLYANITDGLLCVDPKNGKIITGNRALCEMLNYTQEEIRDIRTENLHSKEDHELLPKENEKEETSIRMHVTKKDGSKIHVNARRFPIMLEDKKFLVFAYRDTTEHKKIEADPEEKRAVRENEEAYRLISENMMDAVVICDEKANYVYTSPSNERIFGYKQGELVGRNAFEFFHPEDVAANKERLKLLLEGKQFPSIVFRYRKKNGDYIWCDIAVKLVNIVPGTRRLVVIARDITERKRLQEELKKYSENLEEMVAQRSAQLKKTKEYLQQLVSQLPLAIIAWNNESKIMTWNPEATHMFGFSESECVGMKCESIFSTREGQSSTGMIRMKLLRGESTNIVTENTTKEGRSIICNWTNTPLKDENGNLEGVLSMIQDVTEEKKLQERLKEIAYSLSGVKVGESYLTDSLQRSLKVAFDLSGHGTRGLYIIRENPCSIVKDYNFKPEDIVLLTLNPVKGFKAVNELQEVAIMITKFLNSGGGVVVLGGLEYLISRFGFNPIFMMLQEKRFEVLGAGGTLIVPVNMETLDSKERGLLSSELKFLS